MANKSFLSSVLLILLLFYVNLSYGQGQDKIVGGQATTIMDNPSQVALFYDSRFICGGSLLSTKCVLTAAHCVDGVVANRITVKGGTKNLNDKGITSKGQLIRSDGYNRSTKNRDRAIIKLATPITASFIKPVILNSNPLKPGIMAKVSGWGLISQSARRVQNTLRQVYVKVISKEKCKQAYPNDLTLSMLCAYTEGKDSCSGDSGGPLMHNNKQIGIVSWGYGCANPNSPGVYTNCFVEYDWIKDTMKAMDC